MGKRQAWVSGLAYAGFLRRKNILDKILIGLGRVLFLVFCILFFIK